MSLPIELFRIIMQKAGFRSSVKLAQTCRIAYVGLWDESTSSDDLWHGFYMDRWVSELDWQGKKVQRGTWKVAFRERLQHTCVRCHDTVEGGEMDPGEKRKLCCYCWESDELANRVYE